MLSVFIYPGLAMYALVAETGIHPILSSCVGVAHPSTHNKNYLSGSLDILSA